MIDWAPGRLASRIHAATEHGRRVGALRPIPTTAVAVADGGIRYWIRVVDALRRKREAAHWDQATAAGQTPDNPFLPYDDDLYVCHVPPAHVGVLNKFAVLDHHLLVVTRAFEHQDTLLSAGDLGALWRCLGEVDGLGFYNGGTAAGASQRHKHLQLAPFPLAPGLAGVPVDGVIVTALAGTDPGVPRSTDGLPYVHAVTRIDDLAGAGERAGDALATRYRALLADVGLPADAGPTAADGARLQAGPYNLLLTRRWMLVLPRRREFFETVSLNAVGFAGGLLVRDDAELERVRSAGPAALLRHTGVPR